MFLSVEDKLIQTRMTTSITRNQRNIFGIQEQINVENIKLMPLVQKNPLKMYKAYIIYWTVKSVTCDVIKIHLKRKAERRSRKGKP